MEEFFQDFLLPVMIVVGLPVMVVWLVTRVRINRENKQSEIILESLKNNPSADPEKLAQMLAAPKTYSEEPKTRTLLRGCIWSLAGVAILAVDIYMLYSDKFPFLAEGGSMMLFAGGIALAVGLGYLITYFVTTKKDSK